MKIETTQKVHGALAVLSFVSVVACTLSLIKFKLNFDVHNAIFPYQMLSMVGILLAASMLYLTASYLIRSFSSPSIQEFSEKIDKSRPKDDLFLLAEVDDSNADKLKDFINRYPIAESRFIKGESQDFYLVLEGLRFFGLGKAKSEIKLKSLKIVDGNQITAENQEEYKNSIVIPLDSKEVNYSLIKADVRNKGGKMKIKPSKVLQPPNTSISKIIIDKKVESLHDLAICIKNLDSNKRDSLKKDDLKEINHPMCKEIAKLRSFLKDDKNLASLIVLYKNSSMLNSKDQENHKEKMEELVLLLKSRLDKEWGQLFDKVFAEWKDKEQAIKKWHDIGEGQRPTRSIITGSCSHETTTEDYAVNREVMLLIESDVKYLMKNFNQSIKTQLNNLNYPVNLSFELDHYNISKIGFTESQMEKVELSQLCHSDNLATIR